jgi:hypothetical protein
MEFACPLGGQWATSGVTSSTPTAKTTPTRFTCSFNKEDFASDSPFLSDEFLRNGLGGISEILGAGVVRANNAAGVDRGLSTVVYD